MKQKQLTAKERRSNERFKLPTRKLKNPIIPVEELEGEEWKEVSGTQGYYFVSNKGRVKIHFKGEEATSALVIPANVNGELRVRIKYTPGFYQIRSVEGLVEQHFSPA